MAFLSDSKEMKETAATFDHLENLLGPEKFREMFPIVLTDNGTEFADPDLFERSLSGGRRRK